MFGIKFKFGKKRRNNGQRSERKVRNEHRHDWNWNPDHLTEKELKELDEYWAILDEVEANVAKLLKEQES